MLLAEFFQDHFNIGYTHTEFMELLAKIKDGYVLSESEYKAFKAILSGNEEELQFSGDYKDLINTPDIPSSLQDLAGYSDFISRINLELESFRKIDGDLSARINAVSLFVKSIETVVKKKIEELEALVYSLQLFQGESLTQVISNIKAELSWLRIISDDIAEGKVLSEKDFTEEYEDLILSIMNHPEGLEGRIKQVIAKSIIEPPKESDGGEYRLDSIGAALATKVDKESGKRLSTNDFSNEYKKMLDAIMNTGDGTIINYINTKVERSLSQITNEMKAALVENEEYVRQQVDELQDSIVDELLIMRNEINQSTEKVQKGLYFENGEGPSSIALGGLKKDTVLAGRSVHDVLLEILCPLVLPKVTARLNLHSGGYLNQIGAEVVISGISANIEKGSLPIIRIAYKRKVGNVYETLASFNNMTTSYSFAKAITQSIGADQYIVEVEDSGGNIVKSNTSAIDIIYPTYYGALGEGTITATKLKGLTNSLIRPGGNYKFVFTTNNQMMVFAAPVSHGRAIEIYDQNGYLITNSFTCKELELSFDVTEYIGSTDKTQVNTYKQKYYVYSSNVNTVSSFEVTAKYA